MGEKKDTQNPFKKLDKKKFPKKRKKDEPKKVEPQAEPTPEKDDDSLFFQSMGGVAPLKGKGRAVAPPAAIRKNTALSEEEESRRQLEKFMQGKVEFDLEYTDEFIFGHVKGLDSKLTGRLKAGYYSPEGHLDLHGMNAMLAYESIFSFIREHYLKGSRCVLLIPGRGRNSPEGMGVLREKVQRWLTRDPYKRVVLAFSTALPKHGGAGALYVLLRKKKKGEGKILWKREPGFEDYFL